MMRTTAFVLVWLCVACSAPAAAWSTTTPKKEDAQEEDPVYSDDEEDPSEPDDEDDAGPTTTKFTSYLAASPAVHFGGEPYCGFDVTMTGVVMDLTLSGDRVVSASVKNTVLEAAEDGCPYPPTPPQSHVYRLTGSASSSSELTLQGESTNLPRTALTVHIAKNGDHYDATLTWKRIDDQPESLLWTVTGDLSLEAD